MNLLSADNVGKNFGLKVLFQGLTFGLSKGQKVALVGRNGCGKTTLLRILAGKETPDSGEVTLRGGVRMAFLDQNPDFGDAQTAFEAVFTGEDPRLKAVREYEKIQMEANPDPKAMQRVMDQMENHKAWDYEARVKEILGKVGIQRMDQAISELSGGQKKRLALARVLIQDPDLLILDEPTNHLDTDTIEWLEEYLGSNNMTLIMVTHDRYFLDRVCNEIIEMDQGKVFTYEGDYEYFLEKREERQHREDTDTTRARNLLRTELEWLRRQPKARTTKSKARIDAADDLMQRAQAPVREGSVQMNFDSRRIGSKILEIEHLTKRWDHQLMLNDFTYTFKRGERIGIVGPNGVGKTTFLDVISGRQKPDAGKVEWGETISIGYYQQGGLDFKPGQKVIDIISEAAEQVQMGKGETLGASQALTMFGFPPPAQHQPVDLLSGGEKRRLFLLRILMEQPNFLILDEPTNDLDIITLNTLEQFLVNFPGCLIIVSHDRYFLDKLCDQLFIFEGNGSVKPFNGTFREYRERKKQKETTPAPKAVEASSKVEEPARVQKRDDKKLSFKEQKEYESLEKEIADLEKEKADLESVLTSGINDFGKLQAASERIQAIQELLEEKEMRWLELAERAI